MGKKRQLAFRKNVIDTPLAKKRVQSQFTRLFVRPRAIHAPRSFTRLFVRSRAIHCASYTVDFLCKGRDSVSL